MGKLILLITFAVGVGIAWFLQKLVPKDVPLPPVKPGYFGPGAPKPDSESITAFEIKVSNSTLTDLQNRLKSARIIRALETQDFEYGIHPTELEKIRLHWLNKYDWREWEKKLNSLPQFKTQIEGLSVHFLHVKPPKSYKKVYPLLVVHGWPGSVWEFYKIIPLLTDPAKHGLPDAKFAFEVIAPSIPGYGWSDAPSKRGFGNIAAGRVFAKLMKRLGHRQFYAQGGDWGAIITTMLAQMFPDDRPLHYCIIKGSALNDSPIGLAAYILEKFSTWTNGDYVALNDGGLYRHWTLDELLTNVMIYWTTGSIASSQRFYKEHFHQLNRDIYEKAFVHVPTGVAAFPNELALVPKDFLKYKFRNITHYSDMDRGGHYAAFEEPLLLAEDVFKFVKHLEQES